MTGDRDRDRETLAGIIAALGPRARVVWAGYAVQRVEGLPPRYERVETVAVVRGEEREGDRT